MEMTREIFYRRPLTEAQLLEFADEAGALQGKIDRRKEEIKEYCRDARVELKEWENRLTEVCGYLRDRRGEMEQVKVRERFEDPTPGLKTWYDAETGEQLETLDMTEDDKNSLFAQGKADPAPEPDPEPAAEASPEPGDTPETAIELKECDDTVDEDGIETIHKEKFYRYKSGIYLAIHPEDPFVPCKGCAFDSDNDDDMCPRCNCVANELILIQVDIPGRERAADSAADPAPEPDPEPAAEASPEPGDTPETAIEIDDSAKEEVVLEAGKFYRYEGKLLRAKKSGKKPCVECIFYDETCPNVNCDANDIYLIQVGVLESSDDDSPELPLEEAPAAEMGTDPGTPARICSHCGAVRSGIRVFRMPNDTYRCEECIRKQNRAAGEKLDRDWKALKAAGKTLLVRWMPVGFPGEGEKGLTQFKFSTGKDGAWANPAYFPGDVAAENSEAAKFLKSLLASGAREG